MTATNGIDLLIGVAVLIFILYRQLQRRPVRDNSRVAFILLIIGVIELVQFFQHGHHHATPGIVTALVGSLVIAAVFGAIRAATVHLWMEGGQAWRQGTWLTAVLWVVSLAVHLGYDYLVDGKGWASGLGAASLLLYFGVTFTIQRFILQARAQRVMGPGQQGPGQPGIGQPGIGQPGPGAPTNSSW